MLKHIEGICRSFLWSNNSTINSKAPVAWEKVCEPSKSGGLKVLSICDWIIALRTKLLWSLSTKADKLWVRWIHMYFMKEVEVAEFIPKDNASWLLKGRSTGIG